MAAALALAILLPMVLGLVVGWLSFYHGSTPLYASVISLVFPIVVTQLVYSGGLLTGSSSGLVGYDTLPLELEGFFRLSGLVMVAVTLAAWIFVRSDAGKLLVAVRDNDVRCAYLGVSPKRIQIMLDGRRSRAWRGSPAFFSPTRPASSRPRTPAFCSARSS